MHHLPTICGPDPAETRVFHCFLCHEPLHAADIARAWTRIVATPGGRHVDFAHAGCAFAEGFYDAPPEGADRPR